MKNRKNSNVVNLTPAQKAAKTKGPFWQKVAGIRARITKLTNVAEALSGSDKASATKEIKRLETELFSMGLREAA